MNVGQIVTLMIAISVTLTIHKPVGDMVRSLASMSLCKYRSSAHLLKLTRTIPLSGLVSEIFSPEVADRQTE